jgi:hypothetical protein
MLQKFQSNGRLNFVEEKKKSHNYVRKFKNTSILP